MARLAIALGGAVVGGAIGGPIGARIGWAVGSIAGNYLFAPDQPDIVGPRIEDARITSSAYGAVIPKGWGTFPVAGNIIDASPVREIAHTQSSGGGKDFGGGSQTVTSFTYEADIAVLLGEPIDEILQIFANEELIYDSTPGATVVQPDWLSFTLYRGTETQLPDATLETIHTNVPGYRGSSYVVFHSYQFGSRSISTNFRFVCTSSGTPSVSQTTINLAEITNSTAYSPRSDLIFYPIATNLARTAGVAEPILVGIDPYSRAVVTESSTLIGDQIYRVSDAVSCINPLYVNIPEAKHTAISAVHQSSTTTAKMLFFDSTTGQQLYSITVPNGTNEVRYAWLRDEWLRGIYFDDDASGNINCSHISIDSGGAATTAITEPSGYAWLLACVPVSNGTDKIIMRAKTDPANAPAIVIFNFDGTIFTNVAGYTAPANIDQIVGFAWDDNNSVWWMLTVTTGLTPNRTRIYSVTGAGAFTEYDMLTLYGETGQVNTGEGNPAIWLDTADGVLWWQDIAGTVHAWNPNTAEAPATYSATGKGGGIYHRPTRTLWTENLSGAPGSPDNAIGIHTAGMTGASASLQTIIEDLCAGTEIQTADRDATGLSGVAVQGFVIARDMARRDAIQALRTTYLFDFVPRDGVLTGIVRGGSPSVTLTEDDLGAHIQESEPPDAAISVQVAAESSLPIQTDVTYMSAAQNYEPVTRSARRLASSGGTIQRVQIPVVLTESEGTQLADVLEHLAHIGAETYRGTAMPSRIDDCVPGAVITAAVGANSYTWRLETASVIDGGIIQLDGVRDAAALYESFSVGGALRTRSRTVEAIGTTILWPLDIAMLRDGDNDAGVYMAAGSYTPGWPGAELFQSLDTETYAALASIATHASVGVVTSDPIDWVNRAWDTQNTLVVQAINTTFASATSWDLAITQGNIAAYGQPGRWEIISFTNAVQQGDGSWHVTGLARGLRDTHNHMSSHVAGDILVLLSETDLLRIRWGSDQINVTRQLKGVTIGKTVAETFAQAVTPTGGALKPFAPYLLHGSQGGGSGWTLSWTRQDRVPGRAFWTPVVSEASESYRISIYNTLGGLLGTHTATTDSFSYTSALQTADYGLPVDKVRFSVAQISATVGAGTESDIIAVGKDNPLTDTTPSNVTAYLASSTLGVDLPDDAFDDDVNDKWQSNDFMATSPAWIGVQLTTAKTVYRFTISQEQFLTSNYAYATEAAFEYSDNGTDWTELQRVTLAKTTDVQTFDAILTSARSYYRLRATAWDDNRRWAVREIEFLVEV